jgi:hypothetical protein
VNKFGEKPGRVAIATTDDGLPAVPNELRPLQVEDKSVALQWKHLATALATAPLSASSISSAAHKALAEDFGETHYVIQYQKLDQTTTGPSTPSPDAASTTTDSGRSLNSSQRQSMTASQRKAEKSVATPKDDRWVDCDATSASKVGSSEVTWSFTLDNLQPKSRYAIRVAARNRFGLSAPTEHLILKTRGPPDVCSAPSVVERSKRSVVLQWHSKQHKNMQKLSPVTARLESDQASNGAQWTPVSSEPSPIGSVGNEWRCAVSDLQPATCYNFRVILDNKYGASEPSNSTAVTTRSDLPLVAFTTADAIGMQWENQLFDDLLQSTTRIKNQTVVYVKRESDTETEPSQTAMWRSKQMTSTATMSGLNECVLERLDPDTAYFVRVNASAADNESSQSQMIVVRTQPVGSPAQVADPLIDTIEMTSCRVKWKALADDNDVTYKVESDNGSAGMSWTEVSGTVQRSRRNMELAMTSMVAGMSYLVRVRATNSKGSSCSRPVAVKTFHSESQIDIKLLRNLSSQEVSDDLTEENVGKTTPKKKFDDFTLFFSCS